LIKQKILIITEYFYPEEFKINDVALTWKEKGYDVDVVTTVPSYPESRIYDGYENKLYQIDNWQGIKIYRVKAVTGYKTSLLKKLLKYFSFMFFASFVSLNIGKKYDYIFGFNMASLTGMIPAVLVKKAYKKRLTFWTQDIWPDSVYAYGFKKTKFLSFFLNRFVRFMYHNIDAIAISGKGFEKKLKPYVKTDLVFNYIPNWADEFDINLTSAKLSEEKKIHFTFAGNIGKVQNLENIIQSFNNLDEKYMDKIQLNIIGDGSALNNLKELNKKSNVLFYGRKPREDMFMYYQASDFLIVSLIDKPIFSVTVPAKTQTYIAAKKPILAIINGDTAQIVEENNLGFIAHPNSLQDIENIFKKSIELTNKEKDIFTKNCEKLTNSIFHKNKIIDKLESIVIQQGV